MDTEQNVRRYWAFISYSHSDRAWADWLHKSLENYPMPRDLVGKPCPADAPIPKRFVPVFRDREELPTATDLGAVIGRALKHARFLVVVCSPRSAKSPWVEKEIVEYKRLHGEERVLCLIVDGEPWAADGKPGFSTDDECFPAAVRHRLGPDGELSTLRTEPIAADAREGKDGRENAVIKLMAGLLGVGFDDLRRREQNYQRQRVRRFQIISAVFALLFVTAIAAAVYAVSQKHAVQRTLSQADLQLSIQARDVDDVARSAAYLARSLRSDPENRAAALAAYSMLAHHKLHPPVGPVMRHPAGVTAAFGSADGKFIVTASGATVYLWSRPDHRLLAQRSVDGSNVTSLAAAPAGGGFTAGTAKGNVHFLDLEKLSPLREAVNTGSNGVLALAWNPAGDVLAAGLAENADPKKGGGLLLRLSAGGRELSRLKLEHAAPLTLAWSGGGERLAAAGSSPYFYVSTGDAARPALKEMYAKLAVTGIVFTAGNTLRLIDVMTGLSEWDTATGVMIGRPKEISPVATKIAFSADGRRFLGARRGPAAYVYDAATGLIPTEPISPAFTVSNAIWLDADHALLTSESGMAQVRRIRDDTAAAAIGHFRSGFPNVSAVSRDGLVLAACSSTDPLVRFFDTRTLKPLGRPVRFPSNIHGMGFLADEGFLGALCWDGKFHRVEWRRALKFESGTEQLVEPVDDYFSQIESMRFNPRGTLAVLPVDSGLKLIDVGKGSPAREIPVAGGATAVTWSPDGKLLAAATKDQTLVYFHPDGTPAPDHATARLNAPVVEVSWSPDGRRIAALTNSDRVDFYDPVTGNPTAVSFPTGPSCETVLWVSNGEWLLTSDMNNRTKLWDPDTGVAVAKLPKIGANALRSHALDACGEVLLALDSGFARVPVPALKPPPSWVPGFLEAMGGARLSAARDEPLIDPDAWLAPGAFPAGSGGDAVWSPLHQWLMNQSPERAAFPGSGMAESEARARRALADRDEEISGMRKRMGELWKSNDSQKMSDSIDLMEEALKKDPDLTELFRTKVQVGRFLEQPERVRDSWLGIAAAADSTLLEVLEAKSEAAKAMLLISPPDRAAARKLVEEVLAEDPSQAVAKGVLDGLTDH